MSLVPEYDDSEDDDEIPASPSTTKPNQDTVFIKPPLPSPKSHSSTPPVGNGKSLNSLPRPTKRGYVGNLPLLETEPIYSSSSEEEDEESSGEEDEEDEKNELEMTLRKGEAKALARASVHFESLQPPKSAPYIQDDEAEVSAPTTESMSAKRVKLSHQYDEETEDAPAAVDVGEKPSANRRPVSERAIREALMSERDDTLLTSLPTAHTNMDHGTSLDSLDQDHQNEEEEGTAFTSTYWKGGQVTEIKAVASKKNKYQLSSLAAEAAKQQQRSSSSAKNQS